MSWERVRFLSGSVRGWLFIAPAPILTSLFVLIGTALPFAALVIEVLTHRVRRSFALASSALFLIGGLAPRLVLAHAGQQGL